MPPRPNNVSRTPGGCPGARTAPVIFAVGEIAASNLCYPPAMDERDYWTRKRDEAERELDAAKGRTALNAAAKKLQLPSAELKRLDEQEKSKRPTRGRRSAGASA